MVLKLKGGKFCIFPMRAMNDITVFYCSLLGWTHYGAALPELLYLFDARLLCNPTRVRLQFCQWRLHQKNILSVSEPTVILFWIKDWELPTKICRNLPMIKFVVMREFQSSIWKETNVSWTTSVNLGSCDMTH